MKKVRHRNGEIVYASGTLREGASFGWKVISYKRGYYAISTEEIDRRLRAELREIPLEEIKRARIVAPSKLTPEEKKLKAAVRRGDYEEYARDIMLYI